MSDPAAKTLVVVKNRTRATIQADRLKQWQDRGWAVEDPATPGKGLSPKATAEAAAAKQPAPVTPESAPKTTKK
jgi:hypothetical protein